MYARACWLQRTHLNEKLFYSLPIYELCCF